MTEPLASLRTRFREEALRRGTSPRDVDLLLADVLDRSIPWILAHGDEPVDATEFRARIERRFGGEPLQYIRGRTEFFGREFLVDRRVLIPRPETELVVEAVLERAPRNARVVDVGTGSGCIAISIERERPDLDVTAIDVSIGALAVAAANARLLTSNVALAGSDLVAAFASEFDVVASNPPYISSADIDALEPQVRDHEPRVALTPGTSGLEIIERILGAAGGAMVVMEIGYGQERLVREAALRHGRSVDAVIDDLAGIPRVVVSSKT